MILVCKIFCDHTAISQMTSSSFICKSKSFLKFSSKYTLNVAMKIYIFITDSNFNEKTPSFTFSTFATQTLSMGQIFTASGIKTCSCEKIFKWNVHHKDFFFFFSFSLTNNIKLYPVCVLQNSTGCMEYINTCLYVIKNSKFPFKQGLQSVH